MLEYRKHITRQMLRDERDKIFVFGDNIIRTGYGGQAKEMRGEPNAHGVATKRTPREYMTGTDYDLFYLVNDLANLVGKLASEERDITVVWPLDGIGTGLAGLKTHWPEGLALIQAFEKCLCK